MTSNPIPQPHGPAAVKLCEILSKMPGVGHGRADRLQAIMLSPQNGILLSRVFGVVKSFVPHLGKAEALVKLADALRQVHPVAPDHMYQTTLRRWLDGNP